MPPPAKRILFHTYHFPPVGGSGAQRPLKMALELTELGYELVVVTRPADPRAERWAPEDRSLLAEIPETLDIRRVSTLKERDEATGNQVRVKVVKNKVAPPFKQVEFDIMFGEGISKVGELIDLGVKAGMVEKAGAWFSFDSQRLGQGRENAKSFLKANPDVAAKIEATIRQNSGLVADRILDQADPTADDLDEGEA